METEYLPVDEKKHTLHPESVYAIHKLTVEQYYLLYYRIHKLKTIVFRIFKPIRNFIKLLESIMVFWIWWFIMHWKQTDWRVMEMETKRDFHIQDLSQLFIKSMACPTLLGGILQRGPGWYISILDAAKLIAKFAPDAKVHWDLWPELIKKLRPKLHIKCLCNPEPHWLESKFLLSPN